MPVIRVPILSEPFQFKVCVVYPRSLLHSCACVKEVMEFDRFLDDASLIDALAFLDSYDHHSPATLALPPAFVTAPVAMPQLSVPAKTQRGNGNHHLTRNRGKQKAELERLRLDVKVLESRLARLKKSSDSMSMTASSSSSSEDDGMDDRLTSTNTLTAAWKLVAVRQYQRRKQSEIMNRDLKRALANQHKISGAIQSLFVRRPPQQVQSFDELDWTLSI